MPASTSIKIAFKVGKMFVYLREVDKCFTVGPKGRAYDPVDFIRMVLKTAAERRHFRQTLRAEGMSDLVQDTIPAKPVSRRERKRLTEISLSI